MSKFRQIKYFTLTGNKTLIDLGDQAYGEWIIYGNKTPKYHINIWGKSNSDIYIKRLLDDKTETIKSIVNKINNAQGVKLSFGKRPLIELIKSSEIIELELNPLPENWVKIFKYAAFRRKIRIRKT